MRLAGTNRGQNPRIRTSWPDGWRYNHGKQVPTFPGAAGRAGTLRTEGDEPPGSRQPAVEAGRCPRRFGTDLLEANGAKVEIAITDTTDGCLHTETGCRTGQGPERIGRSPDHFHCRCTHTALTQLWRKLHKTLYDIVSKEADRFV